MVCHLSKSQTLFPAWEVNGNIGFYVGVRSAIDRDAVTASAKKVKSSTTAIHRRCDHRDEASAAREEVSRIDA
jgi:hypothetical protein